MTVTFSDLENGFAAVIEKNRRGKTVEPCSREALSAPAFFHLENEVEVDDISVLFFRMPFPLMWVVTSYKGLGIVALIESIEYGNGGSMPRPDYAWYPTDIGHPIKTTEAEMDKKAAFIIDRALRLIGKSHLSDVDSPVRDNINRVVPRRRATVCPICRASSGSSEGRSISTRKMMGAKFQRSRWSDPLRKGINGEGTGEPTRRRESVCGSIRWRSTEGQSNSASTAC